MGVASPESKTFAPLSCAYRHGDGSAEIVGAELTDAANARVDVVESGEPLTLRVAGRFLEDVDSPVIGFLIRNRLGIHAYGTNTKERQIEFERVKRDEILEVEFSFACWLGVDQYSISLAVHSRDGKAYDWLDAALFFRVTSATLTEGVANLNASITTSHQAMDPATWERQNVARTAERESVTYG